MNNASQQLAIGFDIGGTNVRAGLVNDAGEVLATRTMPTADNAADLEESIEKLVAELSPGNNISGVGQHL